MATYTINGQDVEADSPELAAQQYRATQQAQESVTPTSEAPTEPAAQPAAPTQHDTTKINPADLKYDQDYLDASATWYRGQNGRDFERTGDDDKDAEALANYGKDTMGAFNYRTFDTMMDAYKLAYLPDDQKKAFLYMMNAADHYDWSMEGTGRAAYYMATDLVNLSGLLSLGVGTATGQVAKQGFKALAKAAVVTGLQGAMYNGAMDATRQIAIENAGGQEHMDYGELMGSTALGGAFGGALGAGTKLALDFAGTYLRKPSVREPINIRASNPDPAAVAGVAKAPTGAAAGVAAQGEAKATATAAAPTYNDMLPQDLRGAKPRYGYGSKGFGLDFENDIEKALYITAQANKSGSDEAYRSFLRGNGYTDAEIDKFGPMVKDHIKGIAKDSTDERISIGKIIDRKAPPEVEAAAAASRVPTGSDEPIGPPNVRTGNNALDTILEFIRNDGIHGQHPDADAARDLLAGVSRDDIKQMQRTIGDLAVSNPDDKDKIVRSIAQSTQEAINKSQEMKAAVKAATDPVEKAALYDKWRQFSELKDKLVQADTPLSSEVGRTLGQRVGLTNTGENRGGLTADDVLKEWGITDPANATDGKRLEAHEEVARRYTDIEKQAKLDKDVVAMEKQIADLYSKDQVEAAVRLGADRDALLAQRQEELAQEKGWGTTLAENGNTVVKAATEVAIGNVMSLGTLVRIIIPSLAQTLYRPLQDALGRGLSYDSMRQMASTYSSMFFMNEYANRMINPFRSSFETGRYEQHFLTTEMDRWFERPSPIIPRWAGGGVVRIIPRIVEGLDEFFKQIHYRGAVVGDAVGSAIREGIEELGMKRGSKELEEHITYRTEEAVRNAFSNDIDPVKTIDFLRRQGISNGKTGDTLDKWVSTELRKNGDLFREAQNQAAKNYSDDILFKRQFSGDDNASKIAGAYQKVTNQVPLLRLMGQLFFLTPVRLAETGIQATPGLNAVAQSIPGISTKFLQEVRGYKGEAAQAKALGSVMMSYGMLATFMLTYAKGYLTSGGPEKAGERHQLEDTGDFRSYSVGKDDDTRFGFGRLEPLNFPFKIMANAMDRYGKLQQQRMQGDFVDDKLDEVLSTLKVVTGSIVQAVHDTGIFEGAAQWTDVTDMLKKPDEDEAKWARFFSQKALMAIPHTYINAMKQLHPEITDPASFDQFIRAAINPADPKVSKQYDAFGNVRVNPNTLSGLIGVDITPAEKLKQNNTPQELKLHQWLANIEQENGMSFIPKSTISYPGFETWKDKDLRAEILPSGKGTIKDAWMKEYSKTPVRDELEALFTKFQDQKRISGTEAEPGAVAKGVMQVLNENRKIAFVNMIRNDQELFNKMHEGQDKRIEELTRPDINFNPYGIGRPKF